MNLAEFGAFLVRRGWLALVFTAIGIAAGLAYGALSTPVYKAVTRVAVRPARQADLGQTQAAKELLGSFVRDVHTFEMAAQAAEHLGADWLAERNLDLGDLVAMLRVASDENVYEIRIEARAADPKVAVAVSEKFALAFQARRERANRQLDLRDRVYVDIRDATRPELHSPRRKLAVAAGAAVGLLLGGALMFVWEYLARAVVLSRADAEAVAGAPLLGSIPRRRGRRPRGAVAAAMSDIRSLASRAVESAWPVAALAILGAASGLAVSALQPELFQARTRIALEPARASDWGQTQAIPETMRSFSEDIRTHRMADKVDERLQLDLPAEYMVESLLSVAPKTADYEIYLDIRHPDRDQAAEISSTWADVFIEARIQANNLLDQRDRILVRKRDVTTVAPYSPKPIANTLAGAVLGALLGAAAVIARHAARRGVIHTSLEAARLAGAPALGTVPRGALAKPKGATAQ